MRRRLTDRQRVAACALGLVATALITLDVAGDSLRGAHGGARGALGALYRGTDSVLGPVRRFVQGVPSAVSSQNDVQALRRENADLRGQLAAQAADRAVTERLARLQLRADASRRPVLPGRVIALGAAQGFDWTVTLDVGAGEGVQVDQTVTDGDALVGRVLHVGADICVVLLAVDPGSGVGVRDVRTGELALATGRGTDGLTVAPLDPHAPLRVGDALRTGPAGASTYAPGLAVGTVTAVRVAADGSTTGHLVAATSPTALELVGVILSGPSGPSGPVGSTDATGAPPAAAPRRPALPPAPTPTPRPTKAPR
jgi:rod shape-determining protein MreC